MTQAPKRMFSFSIVLRTSPLFLLLALPCNAQGSEGFRIEQNAETGALHILRAVSGESVLTQEAQPDFRPFLHPIHAPDGKGVLTELSPGHHKHQTGLYWGITRLNGRDYFHHPGDGYWQRKSAKVVQSQGPEVSWEIEYDLLGKEGQAILTETQQWTMSEDKGRYILDLVWKGLANVDVTVGEYNYGGLFLRMPWKPKIKGAATNGAGQTNREAEGQRAPWVDVGMEIEGREDAGHIAILDHHKNKGYPQPWRVDGNLGVGPVRARLGDWTIEKGQAEIIRHRIVVYTGELDTPMLNSSWEDYTGREFGSGKWRLAQRDGPQPTFHSPQEAVERMTLTSGFDVNVWASEPMMTQPMAFCWDDRGRLWIAENRDYETRGRGFSKFGDSRILILEDTDHDGVADKRKVFLEGIPFPAAIAVGMGGLWLGAPPNLLFIPDQDGDDRGDMDAIEVRLTGWGIRDRHETLNSFIWGPDGWLYGCEGFATHSLIGKPAGAGKLFKKDDPFPKDIQLEGPGTPINGGVWRYHPTKERFEVVAHGFSNPWGIDYDEHGQLFITACVIPHLWHVVPGGIYHRQGGSHYNPYVYGDIRTIVDHKHLSAHGGASIYLSDAFPEEYHGQLFMANIHEHAVLSDILEPVGSGFVAHHGSEFLKANDDQWIGFSMEIGPGGGVFVLDWHDADICGKDIWHKESGRIYRIAPKESQAADWPGRYQDLAKLGDEALVQLQTSPSAWHARRARVLLQQRATNGSLASETHGQLRRLHSKDADPRWRLRSMWALHITGGLDEAALISSLDDDDPYVRAWSIQLVCEDGAPAAVLPLFAEMAKSDPSPVVRLYLAAALQRMDHEDRWSIASGLVTHAEDIKDHNIPKMIWFGIEPMLAGNPNRALQLALGSRIPEIASKVARRLTAAGELTALVACMAEPSAARGLLLKGMRDGLRASEQPQAPANWKRVHAELMNDPATKRLAIELAQQFGDRNAARQLLVTLDDQKAETSSRLSALRSLEDVQHPELTAKLIGLLDDGAMRMGAIRAVAAYEDLSLAEALLARYSGFNADERLAVVQTLASRSKYGYRLTQAIEEGEVEKRDVPAYLVRQLRDVVGVGFVEVWGSVESLSSDTQAGIEKYRALLTDAAVAAANPNSGRVVFERTCSACHTMYGEGHQLGPDLTGSNRMDLTYILGNVLDPSEEIQDDYKVLVILTDDGRMYAGILVSEDPSQVTLRIAGEAEDVVIPKSEIESRRVDSLSMMPSGLLDTLADREVLDLISFLRTSEQVELPAAGEERR